MPTPKRWPARPLRAARAAPRGRYRRRPRRPEGVAPAAPWSPRGDHVLYVGEDACGDEPAVLQPLTPRKRLMAGRMADSIGVGRSGAGGRLEFAGGRVVPSGLMLGSVLAAPGGTV